jgi:hypothetical protein
MNHVLKEVFKVGGKQLVDAVLKEFSDTKIEIIGRDQENIILGSEEKNVRFCRTRLKPVQTHIHLKSSHISRKR